jgi:hypothetical protein
MAREKIKMSPYLRLVSLSLLYLILFAQGYAQGPTKARTESGKDVILYPDGTWKYAPETAQQKRDSTYAKPASATASYTPDTGDFVIWYDESKWQMEKRSDDKGHTNLKLLRSDGYAMIISEGIPMPITNLKKIAIENAKFAAPDARIVSEETRMVNGKEVLAMVMDGTIEQVPFRYYGYYYSGKQGTIQFLTYTSQNLFDKYKKEFTDLLNGLEIKD